jgi:hypothetical protein
MLLFSNGHDREARELIQILNIYGIAICVELNVQKSTISFCRLEDEDEAGLDMMFPFNE